MYQSRPSAHGVVIWRSMYCGTPASRAPGPSASAGMRRATAARRKAHSSAWKKLGRYSDSGSRVLGAAATDLATSAGAARGDHGRTRRRDVKDESLVMGSLLTL